jgi:putative hydrolase of the HAD superfamily
MIKAVAIDLDDTLLDTTDILIPKAIERIYKLLQQKGYQQSLEEFNQQRILFVAHSSHKEFFKHLVASNPQLGPDSKSLSDVLIQYFYQPEIPASLPLIAGAFENLEYLSKKYHLYVVTSGVLETQKEKIKALNLTRWIPVANHLIVDGKNILSKKQAFEIILATEQIPAQQLLSFGNRLSQEIRYAKMLGCQTCYFQFGEHADDIPQDEFEKADFTIQKHQDLINTCRL